MTLEEILVRIVDEKVSENDLWYNLRMHHNIAGDNLKQSLKKEGLKIEYDEDQFRVYLVDNHDKETIYVSADINFLFELQKEDYFDESIFGERTGIELV